MYKKIDNTNKTESMVGYIDSSDNVVAIEPGWRIKTEALAKLLMDRFPSKADAVQAVDSAIMVPVFKKDNYEYVDGYGDVLEHNLNFFKENIRKHIGHLFLFMKGTWQYSNDGVDWSPVAEEFKDHSGVKFEGVRDALESQDALVKAVA
jgi:hypothetical protein